MSNLKRIICGILFTFAWWGFAMPLGCGYMFLYYKKSEFIRETYQFWYTGLIVIYILGLVLICRNKPRSTEKEK